MKKIRYQGTWFVVLDDWRGELTRHAVFSAPYLLGLVTDEHPLLASYSLAWSANREACTIYDERKEADLCTVCTLEWAQRNGIPTEV